MKFIVLAIVTSTLLAILMPPTFAHDERTLSTGKTAQSTAVDMIVNLKRLRP